MAWYFAGLPDNEKNLDSLRLRLMTFLLLDRNTFTSRRDVFVCCCLAAPFQATVLPSIIHVLSINLFKHIDYPAIFISSKFKIYRYKKLENAFLRLDLEENASKIFIPFFLYFYIALRFWMNDGCSVGVSVSKYSIVALWSIFNDRQSVFGSSCV